MTAVLSADMHDRIEAAVTRTIDRLFAPYFDASQHALPEQPTGSGVYVVASRAVLGAVKIGLSIDVTSRVHQLSNSSVHSPFVAVGFVAVPEELIGSVERRAHWVLADRRVSAGREFFRCHSVEELREIVAVVEECAVDVGAGADEHQAWRAPLSPRFYGVNGEIKMGRPPLAAKFKRDKQLNVMLTADERERVDRWVQSGEFASPSDVVRAALLALERERQAGAVKEG